MTIATYAQLNAAIADFLNREDLTAVIPTFVGLAEATFNRKLRHWRMETRATLTLDAALVSLPADWLETIRLELEGKGPLRLLSPQDLMVEKSKTWQDGNPTFFAHTGDQIELWPVPPITSPDGILVYFGKIPALSDLNTTNWLLSDAPDLYLYGSLLHSAPYLKDDPRLAIWGGLYTDILNSMNEASKAALFSGPLVMRVP